MIPDAGELDLLQITLVVHDLAATERSFAEALGLEVAFRDPSVDLWGLINIVLPMGDSFIEILSPTRPDTPGGRHLERQGGDGGYMVILQTRDLGPWRERVEALGLRVAFEAETRDAEDGQDWAGIHLHPSDTGGMMISLDQPDPPDSWAGAGPRWREHVRREVVRGLAAIELRSPDPERLAQRWAEVLGRPLVSVAGGWRLVLAKGAVGFRPAAAGESEGLAAVELHASDRARAGEQVRLAGVDFRLV